MSDKLDIAWLRRFEARKGRPLRVLHVGNIANNAYLNAKFLRSVGVDAHVLCYDYYHIMAAPEWEDVELLHSHGDDFQPSFSPYDLRGYRRPAWFVNGPLVSSGWRIGELWGEKSSRLWHLAPRLLEWFTIATTRLFGLYVSRGLQLAWMNPRLLLSKLWERYRRKVGPSHVTVRALQGTVGLVLGSPISVVKTSLDTSPKRSVEVSQIGKLRRIVTTFDISFPNRNDRLRSEDIVPYMSVSEHFSSIFRHYDIVQCYATDPIHALVAEKRPYIAFEHGTLRHFTTEDHPFHRMTALAYRQADHAFITNGDCLAYAEKLGMTNYSPIIHPIDVEQHRRDFGGAIEELRRGFDGDVILFCPTRHDYDIKGTDRFVRALPLIKRRVPGRVKMILVDWGSQVEESKALLRESGCENDVIWKTAMCRITMIKHMRASDVVFDQMVLPVFGSTAPQSIAAGVPVVGSYVPEETRWLIPEPAPILPAYTPEEVADAVVKAVDPAWLEDYKHRAKVWTDTYHHSDVVIREHLRVYRRVLEKYEAESEFAADEPLPAQSTAENS